MTINIVMFLAEEIAICGLYIYPCRYHHDYDDLYIYVYMQEETNDVPNWSWLNYRIIEKGHKQINNQPYNSYTIYIIMFVGWKCLLFPCLLCYLTIIRIDSILKFDLDYCTDKHLVEKELYLFKDIMPQV